MVRASLLNERALVKVCLCGVCGNQQIQSIGYTLSNNLADLARAWHLILEIFQ